MFKIVTILKALSVLGNADLLESQRVIFQEFANTGKLVCYPYHMQFLYSKNISENNFKCRSSEYRVSLLFSLPFNNEASSVHSGSISCVLR